MGALEGRLEKQGSSIRESEQNKGVEKSIKEVIIIQVRADGATRKVQQNWG